MHQLIPQIQVNPRYKMHTRKDLVKNRYKKEKHKNNILSCPTFRLLNLQPLSLGIHSIQTLVDLSIPTPRMNSKF